MDNPPANWRGYSSGDQTLQLPRRTDFGLKLIAHRLHANHVDQPTKASVSVKAKPRPTPSGTRVLKRPEPPKPLAKSLSFDLRIELETQEAQKRLITKVDSAATTNQPLFERIIDKSPPVDKLPYIESYAKKAERFINKWWSSVFYDFKLRGLAGNCRLKPVNGKYGLVYLYIIAGRVRYVGQTTESLYWRMTKRQNNDKIGYPLPIKRNLLNAFRDESLSIETEMIRQSHLDKIELNLIRHFAPANRLWNQKHNPHFELSNYRT